MPDSMTAAGLDAAVLRRRAILSCIIGNLFELFDFGVYGYFAAAIGRSIFPSSNPINSILSSFATYGVGFLMRPVGAMVIGSYGDRYGRKSALVLTVTMMATATGLTGLVPSYAAIGLAAPALLVLCRLMQGFSTGGEWGGAASFMVEYAPPGRRAFFGSLQQVSTGLGQLSSITAAFVLNATLAPSDLTSWGWRVPFLIGFALAPVGYWLRTRVAETPVFEGAESKGQLEAAPLRVAFSRYLKPIAQTFGLTIIWTVASYMFFTFLPTFATSQLHMPASTAFASALIAAIVHVILLPCFGTLADRIGRKPLMLTCAAGFLVLAYPLFSYLIAERNFQAMLTVQLCGAVLYAMINGSASAVLCEMFPTQIRYTALSVGYNAAVMIFGGFAPFIATFLVKMTGQVIAPTYYVMACAFISLLVILRVPDRTNAPLA